MNSLKILEKSQFSLQKVTFSINVCTRVRRSGWMASSHGLVVKAEDS